MTTTDRSTARVDDPGTRLREIGPRPLSRHELLALLLGGPTDAALATALEITHRYPLLRDLAGATAEEIAEVPGVGLDTATRLLAALELARRTDQESRPGRVRMRCPADVYDCMRFAMRDLAHEEFHVVLLNTQNEILRSLQVSRGTLDSTIVDPREVFRPAIATSAAAIVLVHNHPSGDPTPSADDRAVTRQLRAAGEALGIDVIDHIIMGEHRYVSFAESGLLDPVETKPQLAVAAPSS